MANTTADKLNYLIATKDAIKQAIIDKGVTVGQDATFRDYATLIGSISGGGEDLSQEITELENLVAQQQQTIADLQAQLDAKGEGVDTSDATATANDIMLGKTAYVNGVKITGTFNVTESEIPAVGGTIDEAQAVADEIIGNIVNDIVS